MINPRYRGREDWGENWPEEFDPDNWDRRTPPETILAGVKFWLDDLGVDVPGDPSDPDAAVSLCLAANAAGKWTGDYLRKPWAWNAAAEIGCDHWWEYDNWDNRVYAVASPLNPMHLAYAHDPWGEIEWVGDLRGVQWNWAPVTYDGKQRQPYAEEIARGWSKRIQRALKKVSK